ncbi:hypothetical protein C0J52_23270 [Blattella germanica]|nr:hypothetical protein C0J52_23270 [Blattella germanica]
MDNFRSIRNYFLQFHNGYLFPQIHNVVFHTIFNKHCTVVYQSHGNKITLIFHIGHSLNITFHIIK